MRAVIAMDRDGTLETGHGPVPLLLVKELMKVHTVRAVGNPLMLAEIPGIEGKTEHGVEVKVIYLRRWARAFRGDASRFVVVDDQPEQYVGGIPTPWEWMSPETFMARVEEFLE